MNDATWQKTPCPECNAANWINVDADVDSYDCHACGKTICLWAGEFRDEYRPHCEGSEPFDELVGSGGHVAGLISPD